MMQNYVISYIKHSIFHKQSINQVMTEKPKKARPHELTPLSLSKTHYRPYFNGLPCKKTKQNVLTMGPLENIMFDVPPVEEAPEVEYTPVEKLRIKIGRLFEERSGKSKEHWGLYVRKAEIVGAANSAWVQVQSFLLKIVVDLFSQIKSMSQSNTQLQRFKEQIIQNQISKINNTINNSQIQEPSRMYQKCSRTQLPCKFDYTINQYSSILRTNQPLKSKLSNKSEYKLPSTYTGSLLNQNTMIQLPQNTPPAIYSPNNQTNPNTNPNYLLLKISKLQKQLQMYRQNIRNIENMNKQKYTEMQRKIEIELGAKYNQTIQEKTKYEIEVESKRWYNDMLGQEVAAWKAKYAALQAQYQAVKAKYEELKEAKNKMQNLYQYKQLYLMQYEQILQLTQTITQQKSLKQAQTAKNLGLKQKLKQLSKNFNYNYNVSMENERDKQDLNAVLKDFRDWLKFFAVPRVCKGMMDNNTFFGEMGCQGARDGYIGLLPKDDVTNYKLLRPNFFIYFEAYEGIIMAQRKFPQRKVMPPSFYLTIRSILDSMYLHFTFTSEYTQWHPFPQHTISYLQKFQLHPLTQKPMLRKSPCQSEQKINFLLNVFNTQAANTWQCQIFRSFLMEEFTMDQVYFYLQCRDGLLRGAQLGGNFGAGDSIVYIRVEVAEEVIKDRLRNYDREMLDRMRKFLNSKKKAKYGRQLIDLNFVLKLLLQVYSIQKIKSQRFFHHNFKSKSPSPKISYTEYSAFMSKNFAFLTKADIAKLYREMYTLGVSHITYKTIHYVCSMRGLFIPLLKARLAVKGSGNEGKYPKVFEDILFLDLQNSLNNMVVGVEEFGLQDVVDNNISIHKFLHDSQQLCITKSNFHSRLLHQTQKILKIKSLLAHKSQKSILYDQPTKDQIREKLSNLLSIIHQSDEDVLYLKKLRQRRQAAMLKITRNFKIRIQQSLAEFRVGDRGQYENRLVSVGEAVARDGAGEASDGEADPEDIQKDQ